MKKILGTIILSILFLSSCGSKSSTGVYPAYHNVALYTDSTGTSATDYLIWGRKIIPSNEIQTNITSKGGTNIMMKVKMADSSSTGWVDQSSVVSGVITRGVILNSAVIFGTPSLASGIKTQAEPPILAYVLEIKDGEWAKIKPYNAAAGYYLPGAVIPQLWNKENWIKLKEISTNQSDVNLILQLQLATKKYNEKLGKSDFDTVMGTEIAVLKTSMNDNAQADTAAFAQVQKLLDLVNPPAEGTPDDSTESNSDGAAGDDQL